MADVDREADVVESSVHQIRQWLQQIYGPLDNLDKSKDDVVRGNSHAMRQFFAVLDRATADLAASAKRLRTPRPRAADRQRKGVTP